MVVGGAAYVSTEPFHGFVNVVGVNVVIIVMCLFLMHSHDMLVQ